MASRTEVSILLSYRWGRSLSLFISISKFSMRTSVSILLHVHFLGFFRVNSMPSFPSFLLHTAINPRRHERVLFFRHSTEWLPGSTSIMEAWFYCAFRAAIVGCRNGRINRPYGTVNSEGEVTWEEGQSSDIKEGAFIAFLKRCVP